MRVFQLFGRLTAGHHCQHHDTPASLHPLQVYLWHVDMGSLLTAVDSFIVAKPLTCVFSADDSKLAITDSIGDVIVWNILAGCQW